MNGIHDMGGMHGMGPLQYETNESVYHAEWERRVEAMDHAMRATGKIGGSRRMIEEKISAVDYLRMSYYEKWLASLIERLLAVKLLTRDGVENGRAAQQSTNSVSPVSATAAAAFVA